MFSKKYMEKAGTAFEEIPATEVPDSVFAAIDAQGMERRAPVMVDRETGECWTGFRLDLIDHYGNPPISKVG